MYRIYNLLYCLNLNFAEYLERCLNPCWAYFTYYLIRIPPYPPPPQEKGRILSSTGGKVN